VWPKIVTMKDSEIVVDPSPLRDNFMFWMVYPIRSVLDGLKTIKSFHQSQQFNINDFARCRTQDPYKRFP